MLISNKFNILHLDGASGLTVGTLILLLLEWVGRLYNLPVQTILFIAIANVCYGLYALSLAFSSNRSLILVSLLALANATWAIVCFAIVLIYLESVSIIGLTFLCLEGVFVFILALLEWQNKFELSTVAHNSQRYKA